MSGERPDDSEAQGRAGLERLEAVGAWQRPGASRAALDSLDSALAEIERPPLPAALRNFLARADGAEWEGLELHPATRSDAPAASRDADLLTINAHEGDLVPTLADKLIIGGDSACYYVWDPGRARYRLLDRGSLDCFEEFSTFDALMQAVIEPRRSALAQGGGSGTGEAG